MKLLSRIEELLLISVWKLKGNAYAVPIRNYLKETAGKTWALGAIFVMLDRLAKKGLLDSYLSDPTPVRGGRSKRVFKLTKEGMKELIEIRDLSETVWSDIADLSLENIT